jgi:hypothetical protein
MFTWISLHRFDVKPVRNSTARFGRILTRKDGALNVRSTLRMRFCAAYISSFKILFSVLGYIMLSFERIWVSMGVVRHPASYPMGLFPWGYSGRSVKLTTHLHLVSRSRRRGNILPLPQYVFMVWCLVKHRDNFTFTFTTVTVLGVLCKI